MTYGEAIERMKAGAFVARKGWNGKEAFIYYKEGSETAYNKLQDRDQKAVSYGMRIKGYTKEDIESCTVPIIPSLYMFTQSQKIVRGWAPSQEDLTSDDWYVREYAQNC